MYDDQNERIERLRTRFDREVEERAAGARETGEEYLDALTTYVRTYDEGPAGDPTLSGLDTTGELRRVDERAAWAEQERHRVRRAMSELS
jgi:hypothetical protein